MTPPHQATLSTYEVSCLIILNKGKIWTLWVISSLKQAYQLIPNCTFQNLRACRSSPTCLTTLESHEPCHITRHHAWSINNLPSPVGLSETQNSWFCGTVLQRRPLRSPSREEASYSSSSNLKSYRGLCRNVGVKGHRYYVQSVFPWWWRLLDPSLPLTLHHLLVLFLALMKEDEKATNTDASPVTHTVSERPWLNLCWMDNSVYCTYLWTRTLPLWESLYELWLEIMHWKLTIENYDCQCWLFIGWINVYQSLPVLL